MHAGAAEHSAQPNSNGEHNMSTTKSTPKADNQTQPPTPPRDRSRGWRNHEPASKAGIQEDIILECLAGILVHLERRDWSQKWMLHYQSDTYRDDLRAHANQVASQDNYRRIVDAVMVIANTVSRDPYVFADIAHRQGVMKNAPLKPRDLRPINKALMPK
jgi:hypothetical protein